MSGRDPRARMECAICRQPFYDPDQGALPGYDYSARTVSDAHRAMFHSGDEQHAHYDPDYYAAIDRLNKLSADYVARIRAQRNDASHRLRAVLRQGLASIKEPPNVSRETGDTHADR